MADPTEVELNQQDLSLGPRSLAKFDFTLGFERLVFVIIPSAIFVCIVAYNFWTTRKIRQKVNSGYLFWVKLLFGLALVVSNALNVAFIYQPALSRDNLAIGAGVLETCAALCVSVTLLMEHFRSYRPSSLLSLYLAVTILVDAILIRSFFIRDMSLEAQLRLISTGCSVVLTCLEEVSKRRLFKSERDQEKLSKASVSGFWGRTFFTWLNATFWRGFRSNLKMEDLENLDIDLQAAKACTEFPQHWAEGNRESRYLLFWTIVKTCGSRRLLIGMVAYLFDVAATCTQPFIIESVVGSLVNKEAFSVNVALVHIGLTWLAFIVMSISRVTHAQAMAECSVIIKSALTHAVHGKIMMLPASDTKDGLPNGLLTADIPGIDNMMNRIQRSIAGLFTITVGLIYLWLRPGKIASLLASVFLVVCILLCLVSATLHRRLNDWNQAIKDRVDATRNMFANIKSIRMSGLTAFFTSYISKAFETEIDASNSYHNFYMLMFAIELTIFATTPLVTIIGTFVTPEGAVKTSIAEVYAIVAVSNLIAEPTAYLSHGVPYLMTVVACLDRIQNFLQLRTYTDPREDANQLESTNGILSPPSPMENTSADIKHVYSTPGPGGRQTFKDVHVYFPARQITMVIGPIGSGKSTLLKLLAGEASISRGRIEVNTDQVGYCGQTPWIQNSTVRQSIIGPDAFDSHWYATVTEACCLDVDFAAWPNGDKTNAGSNGSSLSGGQKQRVALARAIYSHKPILLLDDIFNGLDNRTVTNIFENLFGEKGQLRATQTTVVMSTNAVEHLKYADLILQLDHRGNLTEVNKANAASVDFQPSLFTPGPGPIGAPDEARLHTIRVRTDPTRSNLLDRELTKTQRTVARATDAKIPDNSGAYWFYFRSFGSTVILGWLFWAAAGEVLFKAPFIYLRIWLQDGGDVAQFLLKISALSIAGIIFSTLSYRAFYIRLIPESYRSIHRHLLLSATGATTHFLAQAQAGNLLNRFGQDMVSISQGLPFSFMYNSMFFFATMATLAIIAVGVIYAAALILGFLIALYGIQRFYLRTSRQIRLLQIESMTPVYGIYDESTTGLETIRAFQWQSWIEEELIQALDYAHKPLLQMKYVEQWFSMVLDLSIGILATAIIAFAVLFPDKASANGVGLALINLANLNKEASLFLRHGAIVESAMGAVVRVIDFGKQTPQEPGPAPDSAVEVDPQWPEHGEITFEKMVAQFDPNERNAAPALGGVDFVVKPGEKVGVVGRTGSGKSTLLMTVLQMLKYDGTIDIDGVELRTVPPETIRARITTIPQEPILLPGTIRQNLYPREDEPEIKTHDNVITKPDRKANGRMSEDDSASSAGSSNDELKKMPKIKPKAEITKADLTNVLKKLELWDYISNRGGIDAMADTMKLSEGQRQLLAVGRGMIHHMRTRSKVVLMDEVTSQLDYETEKRIQVAIKETFKNCTLVVVAHREQTLHDADRIITVDNGQVVKDPVLRQPVVLQLQPSTALPWLQQNDAEDNETEDNDEAVDGSESIEGTQDHQDTGDPRTGAAEPEAGESLTVERLAKHEQQARGHELEGSPVTEVHQDFSLRALSPAQSTGTVVYAPLGPSRREAPKEETVQEEPPQEEFLQGDDLNAAPPKQLVQETLVMEGEPTGRPVMEYITMDHGQATAEERSKARQEALATLECHSPKSRAEVQFEEYLEKHGSNGEGEEVRKQQEADAKGVERAERDLTRMEQVLREFPQATIEEKASIITARRIAQDIAIALQKTRKAAEEEALALQNARQALLDDRMQLEHVHEEHMRLREARQTEEEELRQLQQDYYADPRLGVRDMGKGKAVEVLPALHAEAVQAKPDVKGKGKAVERPAPVMHSTFEVKPDVKGKGKAVETYEAAPQDEPLRGLPDGYDPATAVFATESGTFAGHAYAAAVNFPDVLGDSLDQEAQGDDDGQPGPSSTQDPMPGPSLRLDPAPGSSTTPGAAPGPSSTQDSIAGPSSAPDSAAGPSSQPGPSSDPDSRPSSLNQQILELQAIQQERKRLKEAAQPKKEPRIADEDLPLLQPVAYEGPWTSYRPHAPKKKKKPKKKKTVPVTVFLPDLEDLKL